MSIRLRLLLLVLTVLTPLLAVLAWHSSLLIMACAALAALAAAWLVGEFAIRRPAHRILSTMQRLSAGDLGARVGEPYPSGEIGELMIALDALGETAQRERAKTLRLNAELEGRVAERTQALETANNDMRAFSFAISHDLRAPLRSIRSFATLLQDEAGSGLSPAGADYLKRISAAAVRMSTLIEGLLHLSRVTMEDITPRDINLSGIASDILDELRSREPARDMRVTVAPGLRAHIDYNLAHSLLQNLLINAWKYSGMRPRAEIEFGAAHQNGEMHYFVRDNGMGFDMRQADRLFVPLQRLHTNVGIEGAGIGLATVRRIVHRHGGRVWAEGLPDQGATFWFTLPVAA